MENSNPTPNPALTPVKEARTVQPPKLDKPPATPTKPAISWSRIIWQVFKTLLMLPFMPIVFIARLVFGTRQTKNEVVIYPYPKLLFSWPMIGVGITYWLTSKYPAINLQNMSWTYGIIIVVTCLTMSIDLNRNYTAFWASICLGLWWLGMWLRDVKHLSIFGWPYRFFASLDLTKSADLALFVAVMLGVPYVIMIAWTRVNDKWRITHNEFEHYALFSSDDSLGRGAKRVRTRYPDVFEFISCLAGELLIYDASGDRLLRRIPHIPMLPFVRWRINRILETTQVTTDRVENTGRGYDDDEVADSDHSDDDHDDNRQ